MTKNQGLAEQEQQEQEIALGNQGQREQVQSTQEQSGPTRANKKRLIWVTGGKGGVGKSTFARGLMDALVEAGASVAAFDGDPDNAQLHRYYQKVGSGVMRVELEGSGAEPLLAAIEAQEADVILVDVAAGGSKTLMQLDDEVRLLFNAADMGYQVTIVSVLSRIKDSVNLLKATIDMTAGRGVQLVAVKNLYFGKPGRFRLFDDSRTQQRLVEEGGIVIEMPEMADDTYEVLDQHNLPFRLAQAKEGGLSLLERSRVFRWLEDFERAVADTEGVLWL